MTSQTPDLAGVMARLDMILERLNALEFQVSGLMQSESVEAEAFVLRDERAQIRARLDLRDHAPRLTFYDRLGGERLRLGLNMDGTPDVADLGRR
jgi:hypothetical protein